MTPVTMQSTNFAVFKKGRQRDILTAMGFDIEKPGKKARKKYVVRNSAGDPVHCDTCDTPLTTRNFGSAAKGSRLLFCDNPVCITTWIAKRQIA